VNIIGNEAVEEALAYLAESAEPFANARALRVVSEEKLRIIRSDLFMRATESGQFKTVSDKEAWAFSHAEYRVAVEDLGKAVQTEELIRCNRIASEARIEAWRTMSATARSANV